MSESISLVRANDLIKEHARGCSIVITAENIRNIDKSIWDKIRDEIYAVANTYHICTRDNNVTKMYFLSHDIASIDTICEIFERELSASFTSRGPEVAGNLIICPLLR